eukprot:CAMPEP_0202866216 /NCGR_PEP_ID=MMETSP1391-20130828/7265_1 /ASSEMBLY_ACC=CAM_ASM_000867 /TAXON_ID=1034604 /ORGANISM="Chlamydomonas leiostraca, Strain SAG 11-49" /LENGTH=240 /DNA_ID=CAMNT_0049546149 /DNA_START=69 /DNA_END=791 /DNA_ORIENTATION=+
MGLTKDVVSHDAMRCIEVVGNDEHHIMDPARLDQCEGFVLLTTHKTAVGLAVETGHGVLITRIGQGEHGRAIFSAPVPLETTRVGVGLSLGWEKLYTVMLLRSKWAVNKVAKGLVVDGGDSEVPGYLRGDIDTAASKTHRSIKLGTPLDNELVDCPPGGNTAEVYAATKGFMVADISFSGGKMSPSADLMKMFYGEGVTPEDIISGKVTEPPAEFKEVYRFLRALGSVLHEAPTAPAAAQ